MVKRAEKKGVVRGDPSRTRDMIMQAALEEFAENGFGGGRVDEIAKKAGVNKQALYYHYTNKDGLYKATIEYGYELVRSFDAQYDDPQADPRERLSKWIIGYFENVHTHQSVVALVSEENRLKGKHLGGSTAIFDINAPFVEKICAIYEEGVVDRSFRKGVDPRQLWITIVAVSQFYFSNAFTISHILGADVLAPEMIEARKQHIVDFVIASLRV